MYLVRTSHHIYVSHIESDQRDAFSQGGKAPPESGHSAHDQRWPFHLTVLLIIAISMLLWGLIVFVGNLIL